MSRKTYLHENAILRTAAEGSDTVKIPIMYAATEKVENWSGDIEEYEVGPELWQQFKENFNNGAQGTLNGKPNALPINEGHDRKGRAVGWINSIDYDDKQLYANVKWNTVGKELIEDDIYRQFSVEFNDEKYTDGFCNEYTSTLRGGAVTNIPWYKDLEPLRVKNIESENTMADEKVIENTEEQVDEPVVEEEVKTVDERVDEVVKDSDKEELLIRRLEQVEKQNAKLTALLQAQEDRENDDAVAKAMKEGKITPAQKDAFTELVSKDRQLFDKIVETMPTQIDFSERGVVGNAPEDADEELACQQRLKDLIAEGMNPDDAYDTVYRKNTPNRPAVKEFIKKNDPNNKERA